MIRQVFFVLLLVCFAIPAHALEFIPQDARVFIPKDGDTVYLLFPNDDEKSLGALYMANLMAVDVPDPHTALNECYLGVANEATRVMSELLSGAVVRVIWDSNTKIINPDQPFVYLPNGKQIPTVPRLLVYIDLNGVDVNKLLIVLGFGSVRGEYPADRKAHYLLDQERAQKARRGIWACE